MPARTPPPGRLGAAPPGWTRALMTAAFLTVLAIPLASAQRATPIPSSTPPVASEAPESASGAEEREVSPPAGTTMEDAGDLTEQGAMAAIPWQTAFTGHLHNKIVHFPLALGLAAAVLLIIAPRWPAYEPAARLLLIAGALAAVAAYFSGGAQEDQFDDSPFHSVVELHEKFGIATAITLWAGVALAYRVRARRFLPVYGIVLILLLVCTGFLGGVLSHS